VGAFIEPVIGTAETFIGGQDFLVAGMADSTSFSA
jgi:hypothetical protein